MAEPAQKKRKTATSEPLVSPIVDGDQRLAGLSVKEKAKLRAAYAAVDHHVKDGQVLGIGSGSTIVYAVQRLAERVKEEKLSVRCIPTSFQAIQLINGNNLVLSDLSQNPKIDVAIDGVDEISETLQCIKGGGGCHVQEKIVASCADEFIAIADYNKQATELGTVWLKGIPIEVVPMAQVPVMLKLKTLGALKVTLRMAVSKAGPVVTDNGNFILDAHFGELVGEKRPTVLEAAIRSIAGVVDCGLFVDMIRKAYIGAEDGGVLVLSKI